MSSICGLTMRLSASGIRQPGNDVVGGVRGESEPHRAFRRIRYEESFFEELTEQFPSGALSQSRDPDEIASAGLATKKRFADHSGCLDTERFPVFLWRGKRPGRP